MQRNSLPILGLLLTLGATSLHAQVPVSIVDRLDVPYTQIVTIEPHHARDIASSNWSIGGETLDRGYANYPRS